MALACAPVAIDCSSCLYDMIDGHGRLRSLGEALKPIESPASAGRDTARAAREKAGNGLWRRRKDASRMFGVHLARPTSHAIGSHQEKPKLRT